MVNEKDVKAWVKALRSGRYKQGKGQLNALGRHCCLGVACDIFAKNYQRLSNGNLMGSLPSVNNGAPQWLADMEKDFFEKTNGVALSGLNDDGMGFSFGSLNFDEIADCLEAVYLHKVLD